MSITPFVLTAYIIGGIITAVAFGINTFRRFGSDDMMDDISTGVMSLLFGIGWPLFAVGAVISLSVRALLKVWRVN